MKKWFYWISPCLLAALFCLYIIITSYYDMDHSGGWSYLGIIIFKPVLFIVIGIDIILKLLFKQKPYPIWIIEIIALVIIYFVQVEQFVG